MAWTRRKPLAIGEIIYTSGKLVTKRAIRLACQISALALTLGNCRSTEVTDRVPRAEPVSYKKVQNTYNLELIRMLLTW